MLKKILFAVECLLISCILLIILPKAVHIRDEISAFLPEDNTPIISEIPETSESQTQTEETISETDVATTTIIEIIETVEITTKETTEEITTAEPTTEAPTEPPIIPYEIDGMSYEGTADDEFKGPEKLAELHKTIAKYGNRVSVYYKDLTDGEEYFYNPDENYFIASLIKAPYVVYVYKCLIEMGDDYDPEEKYIYNKSDYREGTGKIKSMEFGTELTLEELIYYAIIESDNVAMDKIRKIFPVSGFIDFADEIGLPHLRDIRSAVNGNICARCAAAYIKAIYDFIFIEDENPYSEVLKELMLSTRNRMIYANYPVIRKYGWTENAFHDMGIVCNEKRPYLIAILSDKGGAFSMFRDISLAVQEYNENKPYEPEETTEEIITTEPPTETIEATEKPTEPVKIKETEPPETTEKITEPETTETTTQPEKIHETETTEETGETEESTVIDETEESQT